MAVGARAGERLLHCWLFYELAEKQPKAFGRQASSLSLWLGPLQICCKIDCIANPHTHTHLHAFKQRSSLWSVIRKWRTDVHDVHDVSVSAAAAAALFQMFHILLLNNRRVSPRLPSPSLSILLTLLLSLLFLLLFQLLFLLLSLSLLTLPLSFTSHLRAAF